MRKKSQVRMKPLMVPQVPPPSELENLDDVPIQSLKVGVSFDRDTGLWKSNSFSQGKVQTDMFEEHLIKLAGERHSFVNPSDLLDSGCYTGPDLIPPIPAGTCVCKSLQQ